MSDAIENSQIIKESSASITQKAIWFVHRLYPNVGVYNVEHSWFVPKQLDLDILRKSLCFLVDRHEMLRTVFDIENNLLVRKVYKHWEPQVDVIDVGDIDDELLSQEFITSEVRKPFDLSADPPQRYIYIKRDNKRSVFLFVVSHILIDLRSLMLLMNELRVVYGALKRGEEPKLPPIEMDYDSYIKAQESYINSPKGKADEAYWLQALSDYSPGLDFPSETPPKVQHECHTHYLTGHIPKQIADRYFNLASQLNLSPYEILFATYILVLHKYTGKQKIAVGTPTAGRDETFGDIYGCFVNTILINAKIDPLKPVSEVLTDIGSVIREGLQHRNYPTPLLAEKLSFDRGDITGTIFQTSFVWENANSFFNRESPMVSWNTEGRRFWDMKAMGVWERIPRYQQIDDIHLSFKIYKFKDSIHWGIEYNIDLIEHNSAELLYGFYEQLIKEICNNPDAPLFRLSILCKDQRNALLQYSRGHQLEYDTQKSFIDYFQDQAHENGSKTAVSYQDYQVSYHELNARANRIAHRLISLGVKLNSIVGVSIKRSIDLIACILGIQKSGAAYLPLDKDYPKERLRYIINDAHIAGIIADSEVVLSLSQDEDCSKVLFSSNAELNDYPATNPGIAISSSNLAYVIYTSGSTGAPKGVEITHGALVAMMHSQRAIFDTSKIKNVLQFASINFDASVFEITMALANGAILHMAAKEDLLGPGLLDVLKHKNINWTLLPPAVLATLNPAQELPDLHILVTGGDSCSQEIVNKWAEGRQLYNAYGPTEATVWATTTVLEKGKRITIGQAIPNTQTYILDKYLQPVPVGVPGELYIGGHGLAKGYLNKPDLTKERFIPHPFIENQRLYKTGDLVRLLSDGNIEFLGRVDHQVKIRGFRVELGEISETLQKHPAVHDALVMARDDLPGATKESPLLAAYVVKNASEEISIDALKDYLKQQLPDHMVPSAYAVLDAFPLTPNEKIDRKALPVPIRGAGKQPQGSQEPRNEIEHIIARVWESCLGITQVSITENFFDLGGHSLLLAQVYSQLPDTLREKLSMVDLFKYPTIQALAHYLEDDVEEDEFYLEQDNHAERLRLRRRLMESLSGVKVAIVGMAGRFPGADNVEQFWQNICDGKETITFFTPEELRRAGVPEDVINHPNYVPAKGMLESISGFDAGFFKFTPREAQITDPQQRLFLECCWEALEDAGCVPNKFKGRIGVYGGIGMNQYLMTHLSTHPDLLAAVGDYPLMIGNDKDFLSTRVSYKLNLNGPAMVLQTACSTSLVAVHTACQALLNEECDAALAGGVSFNRLGKTGYFYHEGMIMSPDGHCRAFDADAQGTVQGQGCGVVLLKRLDDALQNNDHIYAVIVGSATNNDGSNKTGYTAPSIEGQAKVSNMALASANLSPSKVTYIEAHGTGTAIGDPIEIEALRQTFQRENLPPKHCAIGSVKTNIGHLDAASGVVGLIKAAKAAETRTLPPSLHFNKPNPKIDFDKTPFYVNTELKYWDTGIMPRYAGVSSFGIGGTNAHVVISEPPSETRIEVARPWSIVTLSARTPAALDEMTYRLINHLKTHKRQSFANVCYTLHVGRTLFPYRRHLVCRNGDEAIAKLSEMDPRQVVTTHYVEKNKKIVFMFSGQGSQYVNMGRHLYSVELTFREVIDQCRTMLSQKFVHLYEELTPEDYSGLTDKIHQTYITQPGLFIFEYALAKMLLSWGIKPDYMIGHSVGEFAAACLAEVFTLEQALELVTIRGNLIQGLESGEMLSVNLSEEEALKYTNHDVSLAVINGEKRCVLSGASKAIRYLHQVLDNQGIENRILHTSHAFHSHMMEPVLERFKAYVARRSPKAPKIPFISSLTGDWITDEQAMSPQYWADHLRHAVRFHKGMSTLLNHRGSGESQNNDQYICIEVGPGKVLTTLASQHPDKQPQDLILPATRHAYEDISDTQHLLKILAKLWANGVEIDWEEFHSSRQRYRVPLPTYPFERKTYWVRPKTQLQNSGPMEAEDQSCLPDEIEETLTTMPSTVDLPRDDVEKSIWAIWQRALGVDEFGIYDNFFDLGGDSLVAVNLIDQLKKHFKIPIATPVLIRKPTVVELADHIKKHGAVATHQGQADAAEDISSLVVIQPGSESVLPLIMVHPIGGEVFFYRDLAHHLGSDQPLYAFQAPGLSGENEPVDSVPALAELYIKELKTFGVKPPYLLGGSSFGGLVAYEMARQLKDYNEEVKLIVMVDTPAPSQMPRHLTDSAAILEYLLEDKLELDIEKLRTLDENAQISYVLEEARLQGKGNALPSHLGVPLFKTWMAHQQATYTYEPAELDCDVVFFRHSEPQEHFPPLPHLPWQKWVQGEMMVHQVPGNHVSMNYPPHVQTLAGRLKTILWKMRQKE